MLSLVESPAAEGQVFNIGSDQEISINDLARRILELTGSDSPIEHVPYDQVFGAGFEDMRRRTPDLSKIADAIGYRPSLGIDDILRAIIDSAESDAEATL
jgi:UDP-glucose 4-epimerase